MKVKELIEKLKKADQNATVIVTSDNFELSHASVEAKHVHQFDEASRKTREFRDAFDGGVYNANIWFMAGGKSKVVKIS